MTTDNIVREPKRVWDPFEQRPVWVPHSTGEFCVCCGEPAYMTFCRVASQAGSWTLPSMWVPVCGNGGGCEAKAARMLNFTQCKWCGKLNCRDIECLRQLSRPPGICEWCGKLNCRDIECVRQLRRPSGI